ncbi:phosphoribosylamine--glycine ligase [Mollisia scopiformis]|uniref:phosphoribosylamine--glycine ligase n=1 Tax=Mollisia scopiformis TaxID=149040 RepID=A0A194X806_MOLSC|nr:phosphoribosylamine--glycine ligase [Mollisia scopiformis]KUJ16249.1 phosphoribosylamine--glycine ligase [Mollisia scopiformis]
MKDENLSILLFGSGGREHAVAWKLSQSTRVDKIYVLPGNGGTETLRKTENVSHVDIKDHAALINFIENSKVDFVVPCAEGPLVDGITVVLVAAGIKCFGPSKKVAELEGSKAFFHAFTKKYQIQTAQAHVFNKCQEALDFLDTIDYRVVVKASGLTSSKGVIVCTDKASAKNAVKKTMLDEVWNSSGEIIIIEEYLTGEEFTVTAVSDGEHFRVLSSVRDYKTLYRDDQGPNTGGIGSHAPYQVTVEALAEIEETILKKTIAGMGEDVGFLNVGIILSFTGPKVIDYDVRLGDPETQAILPLLKTDLAEILLAGVQNSLGNVEIVISQEFCVSVVLCGEGYPGKGSVGKLITIADGIAESTIFHGGTVRQNGKFYTTKGRVMQVTAIGPTLKDAANDSYSSIKHIKFDGMRFRDDIGAVVK